MATNREQIILMQITEALTKGHFHRVADLIHELVKLMLTNRVGLED